MTNQLRRRRFLKTVALGGIVAAVEGSAKCASPNSKVNIACVGVGGKGWSDMLETSVGLVGRNLWKLACLRRAVRRAGPFWAAVGVWNATPAELSQTGWPAAHNAVTIAPDLPATCWSGGTSKENMSKGKKG